MLRVQYFLLMGIENQGLFVRGRLVQGRIVNNLINQSVGEVKYVFFQGVNSQLPGCCKAGKSLGLENYFPGGTYTIS